MQGRMLDKYIFGAHAILLIYDVTNSKTFENLETWLRASQRVTGSMEKPPMYALVANKIDQEHLRTVKSDRHHRFAQVSLPSERSDLKIYFGFFCRIIVSLRMRFRQKPAKVLICVFKKLPQNLLESG